MHEVDMTRALIQTLTDWWEAQPDQPRISAVHLKVGDFTCVEPASLQLAYATQIPGTCLSGSQLVIQPIPLVAYCQHCQAEYSPVLGLSYACPTCQAPMESIRSGRELKIDHIDYTSEVACAPTV